MGDLHISLLTQGVHSGAYSGIVVLELPCPASAPRPHRGPEDGADPLLEFFVDVPKERLEQADQLATILGESVWRGVPTQSGVEPNTYEVKELILNKTWRPALAVWCWRSPSACRFRQRPASGDQRAAIDPRPAGCRRTCCRSHAQARAGGRPALRRPRRVHPRPQRRRLERTGHRAVAARFNRRRERAVFGREVAFIGEGGSIPFMAMLGLKFPKAQFLVTGLLGPESSAHGPNQFLHVPTGKRLTASVAKLLADHFERPQ